MYVMLKTMMVPGVGEFAAESEHEDSELMRQFERQGLAEKVGKTKRAATKKTSDEGSTE